MCNIAPPPPPKKIPYPKRLVQTWIAACTSICMHSSGVPAKMSTRENVLLTILRQRILIQSQILQSNAAAKMCTNHEFGHPTHCILHKQCILHAVIKLCCCVCTADLTVGFVHDHSRWGSAPARNQCLANPSLNFRLLFVFPKKCTWFRCLISQFRRFVHRRRWCNLQNSSKYRYFICVLSCILPSIPCLTAHNKITKHETKTLITSWEIGKKELKEKQWNARVSKFSSSSKPPGEVRARTIVLHRTEPIKVNRFIDPAKSPSSYGYQDCTVSCLL